MQTAPKLPLHSSKPAHTSLFAIKPETLERYHVVDPGLVAYDHFFVRRSPHWPEGSVNFAVKNQCDIVGTDGMSVGHLAEHNENATGFIGRLIKGSRRSFNATIWDQAFRPQMLLRRPFYFLFSDLFVSTTDGGRLGSVHRTFSLFCVEYELKDSKGRVFARIKRSYFGRKFSLHDNKNTILGEVSRDFSGNLFDMFSSSDSFEVTFSSQKMPDAQKAVLVAATASLDLGFLQQKESK